MWRHTSSDKELIEQQILKPLMMDFWIENSPESFLSGKSAIEFAKSRLLFVSELSSAKHLEGLLADIWQGSTTLFIEGSREVLVLGTGKGKSRSIGEPLAEPLVRGPRLGFNENLVDNITILRQLGETDSLTILPFQVGVRSRRDLIIAYIADIADPNVVREVSSRIENIDFDHIPDTGYVEQLIEEHPWTPFPQLQNTERPDRVMSCHPSGDLCDHHCNGNRGIVGRRGGDHRMVDACPYTKL
ncbi:hypothetical protein BP422_09655 [Brevibacillus formosus]|uniref:Spore germination protein n=1 Tax=Brevibacillus formosus TaxID=54913 RepID=A0A220MFH8_9BACL|nr:spore germination protein [Brevibacillus formosus]ASJ53794.1 hypothetical protein BP422_09655 [Brevibacillus formosus]